MPNEMSKRVWPTLREANLARQQEWDGSVKCDGSYKANEMGGETGEALEVALKLLELAVRVGKAQNTVKKLERERLGMRGSKATREQLEDELGDVLITVDLLAIYYGIDPDQAARKKFNKTSAKVGLKTRVEV